MTDENKRLRDTLKAIEGVITTALAHQPEDDAECKQHLEKAMEEVKDIVSRQNTALWVSLKYDTAVCSKCGNDIDTGFETTAEAQEKWGELYSYCPYCGAKMERSEHHG